MQNLLKFLFRFRRFLLFLVLQGFAVFLISKQFAYQRSVVNDATSGITGWFWGGYQEAVRYLHLTKEVEALRRENATLRGHLRSSKYLEYGNSWGKDSSLNQAYRFLPAEVLHLSTRQATNYFTLNVGQKHGVRPNMGVLAPEGVVGVITRVSDHFSGGISLLNSRGEMQLSVQLRKDGDYGTLVWDGNNPCCAWVENVGSHVEVAKGDTIETSLLSTLFPPGIAVGTVDHSESLGNEPGQRLYVKLFTPFGRLHSVYVVDYLLQQEKDSLEEEVQGL